MEQQKDRGLCLQRKGNTYFDYLIECGSGVSEGNLLQNLERFGTMMAEFTTYIG